MDPLTLSAMLSDHALINLPACLASLDIQIIFKVSVHNARLDMPKDPSKCPPAMASLLTACWENIPESRPLAEEVQQLIERILDGIP